MCAVALRHPNTSISQQPIAGVFVSPTARVANLVIGCEWKR